jgi:hypothetical protein
MTVRELLGTLQRLPRDAELLAMEGGCEEYCEREVDDYLGPETRPSARPARVPNGRVLPGGHRYLPLSSTRIPGTLRVQPMLPPDSR